MITYDENYGFIYCLLDSRDPDNVRYIGQTIHFPDRFYKHIADAYNPKANSYNNPSARWIRKIGKSNVIAKPLFYVTRECLNEKEIYAIAKFKPDLNISPGGIGGIRGLPRSEETRAKISAAKLGKPQPWQSGENHWNYGKGRIKGKDILLVHKLRSEGMSVTKIAAQLKVSRGAVYTALNKEVLCEL